MASARPAASACRRRRKPVSNPKPISVVTHTDGSGVGKALSIPGLKMKEPSVFVVLNVGSTSAVAGPMLSSKTPICTERRRSPETLSGRPQQVRNRPTSAESAGHRWWRETRTPRHIPPRPSKRC